MKKERLDKILVDLGYFETKSKAAASIFVLIVMLPFIAQELINDMMTRANTATGIMQQVGEASDSPLNAPPPLKTP